MTSKVLASKIDLSWASPNVKVWIELPENDPSGDAYRKGVLINLLDEETANVQFEGSSNAFVIKGDKIFPVDTYPDRPEGYDDMVDIEHLSEAELLNNVQLRYNLEQIYTYVGPTLIVINPFRRIEKLLNNETLSTFQDAVASNNFELKDHTPHVYAIAAATMQKMFEEGKNQAIVISGESGAGKTENTKHAMKFLTSLGSNQAKAPQEGNIEDRILACNPILEAFGNAKTMRNDNSSRFGKYVSLLVDKSNRKIIGATITNYLLEKSRVCSQTGEERSYHIYYALLKGASEQQLKDLFLSNSISTYEYLTGGFQGEVKTVPDQPLFQEVCDSFKTMSFSEIEQKTVWGYTAASLLLGNVSFDDSTLGDSTPCGIKNEDVVKNIAKLLGLDFNNFAKSLRYKLRTIGGSTIESTITKEECVNYRDGLAKELFNRLFNWLVKRLNYNVMPEKFAKPGANISELMNSYYHIGLLDIFGFEIFKINSLEQFCINFANERLQQLYISYVFKAEEKEFIREGLKDYLHELNFKDNQVLLDMLDGAKPPGIFQLLDESSTVTTTDSNLANKIVTQFKKPEYPLTTAKMAKDTFIVKHSAKDVEYNVNGFRAKNKDELSKFIEDNLNSSAITAVAKVWKNLGIDEKEPLDSKKASNPKDKFLGYKFRTQMKELVDELHSCQCHFIRCLKPNDKKEASSFVSGLVLQQIQYMGVLDTIKVRKQSYPVRRLYKSFYERYQELDPINSKLTFEEHIAKNSDFKLLTKQICEQRVPHLGTNMILHGETRIFLRIEAVKELEKLRTAHIKKKNIIITKFQSSWLAFKQKKKYNEMKKGVMNIQKLFKVGKEFQKYQRIRRGTKKIQRWWRYLLWRKEMRKIMTSTVQIQAWFRSVFYKQIYLRKMEAIKLINRIWRGTLARRKVARLRHVLQIVQEILQNGAQILFRKIEEKAAAIIQRYTRGYLCRVKYQPEVVQIKKAKSDFVYNKNIRVIQRNVRGFLVRSVIARMKRSAFFIQGHVRMRWLSALFQALRVGTLRIQRAVRAWLTRRHALQERMQDFLLNEAQNFETSKKLGHTHFFGSVTNNKPDKKLIASVEDKKATVGHFNFPHEEESERNQENPDSNQKNIAPILNTDRELDPYAAKKMFLFARIIDVDPLSDIPDTSNSFWSLQTLHLQNDCMRNDSELQVFEVGQAHTLSISNSNKIYSYGWNDHYQLGRQTSGKEISASYGAIAIGSEQVKPKCMAAGEDHNLLVDCDGNLYVWGDNSKGQLGIGSCRQTPGIILLGLTKNDPIKEVKAKGFHSIAITEKGKAIQWPVVNSDGELFPNPSELYLPPKIEIATAACGYGFSVLVSRSGHLFTFGQNQAGQLGHGDILARDSPTLVESLKTDGEKISSVSCGYKHVICKTSLGKVYTWGWGASGQLGHDSFENELYPRAILSDDYENRHKSVQVQAGYKHSIMVLENRKILWFGTNGTIHQQSVPIELNLYQKVPNMNPEFTLVRVLCAWSKTTNITYATFADSRSIRINPNVKNKVLGILTTKMDETHAFNDVFPPSIPSISKYFNLRTMDGVVTKEKKNPRELSPTGGNKTRSPSPQLSPDFLGKYETLRSNRVSPSLKHPQQDGNDYETLKLKKGKSSELSPKRPSSRNGTTRPPSFNRLSNPEALEQFNKDTKNVKSSSRLKQKSQERQSTPLSTQSKKAKTSSNSKKTKDLGSESYLFEKLVEIKTKMKKISNIPKDKWSKSEKEFWKYATEPQMYALLKDLEI